MIKYNTPYCYRNCISDDRLMSFDLAAAELEIRQMIEENKKTYNEKCLIARDIEKSISNLHGENSKIYKYVQRNGIIERPPDLESTLRRLHERKEKIEQTKKKQELEEKKKANDAKLLIDAVIYLQSHGKTFGVDFTESDAINTANHIAWDLEIAKIIDNGEFISFSGDDECEGCEGWDGKSYRCQCGNRRVDWEYDGDFRNPFVYGQAY
jgi:hypothetical protein